MRKLTLADIRPHVRYSKPLLLPEDFSTTAVHAYDARLVYFFSAAPKSSWMTAATTPRAALSFFGSPPPAIPS